MILTKAEIPNSPVSIGMVDTWLPTPGAMGYRLAGRWAMLPKQYATGNTTATLMQPGDLLGVFDRPITLGAHVIAKGRQKVSGLGGTQTGDPSNRQPLYNPALQRVGFSGSSQLRRYGSGI